MYPLTKSYEVQWKDLCGEYGMLDARERRLTDEVTRYFAAVVTDAGGNPLDHVFDDLGGTS